MTDRLPARRSSTPPKPSGPPKPSRTDVPDVEPTVHVEAVRERVDQLIDEIDGRLRKLADADARSLLEDTRATLGGLKRSLEAFAPPPPGRKDRIEAALDAVGAAGPAAGAVERDATDATDATDTINATDALEAADDADAINTPRDHSRDQSRKR
jgi:hypothetical protein